MGKEIGRTYRERVWRQGPQRKLQVMNKSISWGKRPRRRQSNAPVLIFVCLQVVEDAYKFFWKRRLGEFSLKVCLSPKVGFIEVKKLNQHIHGQKLPSTLLFLLLPYAFLTLGANKTMKVFSFTSSACSRFSQEYLFESAHCSLEQYCRSLKMNKCDLLAYVVTFLSL